MNPQLATQLEALLGTPVEEAPPWPELEPLVTDGYAHALDLELERRRIARILEADGMGDDSLAARDLELGARIHGIRQQLAAVRRRFQPGRRS